MDLAPTGELVPSLDLSGMEWVTTNGGPQLGWTTEPDMEVIKETIKDVMGLYEPCTIQFHSQSSFDKVYMITFSTKPITYEGLICNPEEFPASPRNIPTMDLLIRVSLPVDPKWKTLSEVATLEWVGKHTSLPVPRVLRWQSNRSSNIGFEWTVTTKLPGRPLDEVWPHLEDADKIKIVCQLAQFQADCFKAHMRGIGNLYPKQQVVPGVTIASKTGTAVRESWQGVDRTPYTYVKRLVSRDFVRLRRQGESQDGISRGAFRRSYTWMLQRIVALRRGLAARLEFALDDIDSDSAEEEDNGEASILTVRPEDSDGETSESKDSDSTHSGEHDNGRDDNNGGEDNNSGEDVEDPEILFLKKAMGILAFFGANLGHFFPRALQTNQSPFDAIVGFDARPADDPERLLDESAKLHRLQMDLQAWIAKASDEMLQKAVDKGRYPDAHIWREASMLHHAAMHGGNILVGEDGNLSGVTGWEDGNVSVMPLWRACDYPLFLRGRDRVERPVEALYREDEETAGRRQLFGEHVREFELTGLRRVFAAEMLELEPRWLEVYNIAERERGVDRALEMGGERETVDFIHGWLLGDERPELVGGDGPVERVMAALEELLL